MGPLFLPALKVQGIAANIDQSIDRGRPAQDLAARGMDTPPAQGRFRLSLIVPNIAGIVHWDRQGRRHLDEDRAIATAALQQQNLALAILGQAIGQNTARRSCPHDDVVKLGIHRTVHQ